MAMDKKLLNNISYGLYVLTAREGDRDNGCIINTAAQPASEPLMVSVAVNKANHTCGMIERTKKFTVSLLSEQADFSIFKHFGFQSGRDVDKFADFKETKRASNGLLAITKGTNSYICVEVKQMIDLGSHMLFIGEPVDGEKLSDSPSATYAYYFAHIKPKPEAKPAAAEKKKKVVWRCIICGYEYDGEELPADFICPLCKHPASDFEKVVIE